MLEQFEKEIIAVAEKARPSVVTIHAQIDLPLSGKRKLVVSGIVHNEFDTPATVRVVLKTDGGCLELLDRGELSKDEQSFTIAAHQVGSALRQLVPNFHHRERDV